MRRIITITCTLMLCLATHAQRITAERNMDRPGVHDAQFPGGERALEEFICDNIEYPLLQKKQKEFVVMVDLLIHEDGTPTLKGVRPTIHLKEIVAYNVEQQIKTLIEKMPAWIPAKGKNPDGMTAAIKSPVQITVPFRRHMMYLPGKITVKTNEAGMLDKILTQEQKDTCRYLEICGQVNSEDIAMLRRMAGGDGGKGCLEVLDMSNANIVNDTKSAYLTLDAADHGLVAVLHKEYYKHEIGGNESHSNLGNSVSFASFPQVNRSTHYYRYKQGMNTPLDIVRFVLNDKEKETNTNTMNWYEQESLNRVKLKMKKTQKFKGHVLSMTDGRCTLKAYTVNGKYCKDMFYHCPKLKYIITPYNHKVIKELDVEFLQHKYLQ